MQPPRFTSTWGDEPDRVDRDRLPYAMATRSRSNLVESIDADEIPDDPRIVHGIAVPSRLVRVRGNVELAVPVDQCLHSEPSRCWARRRIRDQSIAMIEEPRLLALVELDAIAVLVDKAVVVAAQADQVSERGLATIGPVMDMVTLDEDAVAAAREAARRVSFQQRTLHRRGDRARLPTDGQRRAGLILDHVDDAAVAREATGRFRGNAGAIARDRERIGARSTDSPASRRQR